MYIYHCHEIYDPIKPRRRQHELKTVVFKNFSNLHDDGQKLIKSWAVRAWDLGQSEEHFEPFIFAWFAFNGWACCITDTHVDSVFVNSLIANRRMCSDFERLVQDTHSQTGKYAKKFTEL